jgi:hypothetical protein
VPCPSGRLGPGGAASGGGRGPSHRDARRSGPRATVGGPDGRWRGAPPREVTTLSDRAARRATGRRSQRTSAGALRSIAATAAALVLLAGLGPLTTARTARAAETVALPFAAGRPVRIIQGYNGGTHRGRSQYGLDLVLAGGATGGAEVLAPIDGLVASASAPGAGNGCITLAFRDGGHSVMLCHVLLNRSYRRGEAVARADPLGTVGAAGTLGNNGTPHVHMELHRGGLARGPVPFGPPAGLPLEGVNLPTSGAYNEHALRAPIASTNGAGPPAAPGAAGGSPARSSPAPRGGLPQPARAKPAAPPPSARAPEAAAGRPGPATAAPTPVRLSSDAPASPGRAAVVDGTGSCLQVREQPSLESPVADCLPDGTEVPLTGAAREDADHRWRQVAGMGWAAAAYLRPRRAVVAGTGDCLNVREQPSTDALVVGCLPDGTPVVVVEGPIPDGPFGWYRIGASGSPVGAGWVVAGYLS